MHSHPSLSSPSPHSSSPLFLPNLSSLAFVLYFVLYYYCCCYHQPITHLLFEDQKSQPRLKAGHNGPALTQPESQNTTRQAADWSQAWVMLPFSQDHWPHGHSEGRPLGLIGSYSSAHPGEHTDTGYKVGPGTTGNPILYCSTVASPRTQRTQIQILNDQNARERKLCISLLTSEVLYSSV